jgi:phage shock protein B
MKGFLIIATAFGGIILTLVIICSTILMGIKILRGGVKEQKSLSEEARMIQEIHKGLSKMEERVEALETLLLEKDRKDRMK